ncbi:hypothetical protein [Streptomyces brasiliensis]|uniref:Uncharacterized protein n=1 Tax=Streptomyces brasiliensis TaxID=1954 RepID=A0A917UKD5_9ACTN|nr:hypothetical protein [Streptomyces brasiliensis]GGJ63634.1 hypothetical protein GCM10010121_087810 [Streptomyces brasiliensis]
MLGRLAIEFFRATLPATLLGLGGFGYVLALVGLARRAGPVVTPLVSPLLAMAALSVLAGCCVLAKWVVAGRYRPRVEPLWSLFVRRTEFVTGLFEAAAVPRASVPSWRPRSCHRYCACSAPASAGVPGSAPPT